MEKVLRISVSAEIKDVAKTLKRKQKKQIPFATSVAINNTLFKVRNQLQKDMDTIFRGGAVSWTRRAVKYKKSNKKDLTGILYLEREQYKYLKYQIYGGVRPKKGGKSIPIPFRNRVSLTKAGNLRRAQIARLLSAKQNKLLTINGVRGIYKVKKKSAPVLLVAMQQKSVTYTDKKFKYFYLVKRSAKKHFKKELQKGLQKALKTAF